MIETRAKNDRDQRRRERMRQRVVKLIGKTDVRDERRERSKRRGKPNKMPELRQHPAILLEPKNAVS